MEQSITEKNLKGTVKDSVFRNLFGQRKYALQLYQAIHPEDTDVTEDDISDVTIDNILTDQQYNDLGMTVRGKLLVLLSTQETERKGQSGFIFPMNFWREIQISLR